MKENKIDQYCFGDRVKISRDSEKLMYSHKRKEMVSCQSEDESSYKV